MRDIPGYVDTRQQLLQLKSNVKGHWLGFAIAHHLNGNHALAVQILEAFEQTQEGVPDNEQYEQSEMVMYKAMILREGGELEQALELLQTHKVSLCVVPLEANKLCFQPVIKACFPTYLQTAFNLQSKLASTNFQAGFCL